MSIHVSMNTPDIEAAAYVRGEPEEQRVSLADYRGSWVVLFFYPRDFTFICPTELQAFAELAPEFEAAEAQIVAASTDSYWSHRRGSRVIRRSATSAYPVVADTAHELSKAFGVLLPDGSALRGTFVIDPEGVVRYASVVDQSVGRSPEEVLRVVHALRTGELCPVNWKPGKPTLSLAA